MSAVIDFAAAKKAKTKKQHAANATKKRAVLTDQEVFQDVFDDVLTVWESHAAKNKLNALIDSKIPAYAKSSAVADYVNDLNVISAVERKLDMHVAIATSIPGISATEQIKWLVGFYRNKELFAAPPQMTDEGRARIFSVLLFLALEPRLKISRG